MPPRARKSAPVIEGVIVDKVDEAPADKEWGSAELNGRRIEFNQPNPAQLIVLRRLNRQLDTATGTGEKFLLVAKMLDAVSALMVSDVDREWADMEVLEGRADLDKVTPLMIAAIGGNEVRDSWEARQGQEEVKPPRRVRRARS